MRQAAYANGQKFMNLQGFKRFLGAHKILLALACAMLLALLSWLVYNHIQNSSKFSRSDFNTLGSTAKQAVAATSKSQVYESKTCSYESPEELGIIRLYCTIQGISYMPYKNDAYTNAAAESFQKNIQNSFGEIQLGISPQFLIHPFNNEVTVVARSAHLRTSAGCNFYIDTGNKVTNLKGNPPQNYVGKLISLSYECSAESQGEYFPVTYRQGA